VIPVLPPQGVGVFDTCLLGRVAVPAFWFLSIWNAKPTSRQNSEKNSAAPIESSVEFLYMTHLRMVAYVDHFHAMRNSNQHAS
jgi:hypothetical protein